MRFLLILLGYWLGFAVLAVILGILREKLLTPRLGPLRAHQIGTVFGSLLFFALMLPLPGLLPGLTPTTAWAAGILWLVLTIAFEFVFGHWVAGHPWSHLLADYDLTRGRIWPLVLVTVLVGPRVVLAICG